VVPSVSLFECVLTFRFLLMQFPRLFRRHRQPIRLPRIRHPHLPQVCLDKLCGSICFSLGMCSNFSFSAHAVPTPLPTPLPTDPPVPDPTPSPTPMPVTPNPTPQPGPDGTGLQSSCFEDDTSGFDICVDLVNTSPGGGFDARWMKDVLDAALIWEEVITGDLPSVNTAGLPSRPAPPNLSARCTAYPPVIDDLYVCAQNRDFTSSATAFAGPYLWRRTSAGGLPYAARIGVNNAAIASGRELDRTMIHEFAHALGL